MKDDTKIPTTGHHTDKDTGKIPLCPHCGDTRNTYRTARASGTVELYYDEQGEEDYTYSDDVYFEPWSEAVRCCSCQKIRRDVSPAGRVTVQVVQEKTTDG